MPAAQTKDALIAACEAEFGKLTAAIAGLPVAVASAPDADGWSIRAVVAHRAHWIDLFLGWWDDGKAGRSVHMPAEGYGWGDLKAYNAQLATDQSDLSWDDAMRLLVDRHQKLMAVLNELDEAQLYGAPMIGGNGKWTAGRYAEAAGASHYRSALKFVRRRLREAQP